MQIIERIILTISLFFLISCNSPQDYLNDAVDILKENSINKYSVDWEKLRNEVLEKGKNAKSIKETYPAIRFALSQL